MHRLENVDEAMDAPDRDADGDPVGAEDAISDRSLIEDVRALFGDSKLLAEAELEFQKKRLAYGAQEAKGIVAAFAIAAALAFFAVMALVFGLVLALGQVITYWGSTAVVMLGLLAIAFAFVRRARARIASLKRVAIEEHT